jgi:hypothetical protein
MAPCLGRPGSFGADLVGNTSFDGAIYPTRGFTGALIGIANTDPSALLQKNRLRHHDCDA